MQDDKYRYEPGAKGFAKDIGRELGRGLLSHLKWTGWGAAIGSISGAGFGLYLSGTEGLAFLGVGGLVVGAIAGFLLRFFLTTVGPLD